MNMKKVLIIGGGFAGSLAAKGLESDFKVTLIDCKEYFEFTPGILRSIVDLNHTEKIQVSHISFLKKTNLIRGEVIELAEDHATYRCKNKNHKMKFDYCIITSGSSYESPIKSKNLVMASRSEELKKHHNKLENSSNILIIGGGLVGVELVGEILDSYSNKNITIVTSSNSLIPRQNKRAISLVTNYMKKNNVKIIFNEKVTFRKEKSFVTDKKRKIFADIAFYCTGISPNTKFMLKNFESHLFHKKIKVNEKLFVLGSNNIFAAGDIIALEKECLAQAAEKEAEIIIKNIKNLEKGKKLISYFPKDKPVVISLGKYNGILTYKKFSFSGIIPAFMKFLIERWFIWNLVK